jgi:hypothetical protein
MLAFYACSAGPLLRSVRRKEIMPHCNCGFDFAKAGRKRQPLVSYALIPDDGYEAAIRREHVIVVEKDPVKKSKMIAQAARSVGSLMKCPDCGAWLLTQPLKRGRTSFALNSARQRCGLAGAGG